MPNGADIKLDFATSFLLVGDGGTRKTTFIGTCPQPSWTADFDIGMAVHRGRADMDYDTFNEVPRVRIGADPDSKKAEDKIPLTEWQKANGWYEWGTAYPAFMAKLNKIGVSMDTSTNKYKTLGVDSLTRLTDAVSTYIKKQNATSENPSGEFKDGRQFWGMFLIEMSNLFGQFSAWPVVKVLTAHIKRDENIALGTTEKLPLVSGQFAGKVGIYFDEVYYTDVKVDTIKGTGGKPDEKKETFFFRCHQDGIIKMAKSRKYNLPDGLPTDFQEIMKHVNSRKSA